MDTMGHRPIAVGLGAAEIDRYWEREAPSTPRPSPSGTGGDRRSRGACRRPHGAERRLAAGADDAGIGLRSLHHPSRELLDELKAYLVCRSRGVEPPRPLTEAWEGFYDYYAPRIRSFLRRWALSEADRNDCLQDVWQDVVARLEHFAHDPGRACLSTWLMTLARNKAVDTIRRRSRHAFESLGEGDAVAVRDPGPDPADAYERSRTQGQVRSVLAELSSRVSPTSFQVLYLRWIEGRTTSEVADALELTPDQVRFRAHRMKRKVRDLLERSIIRDTGRGDDEKIDRARNGSSPTGE